MSDRPDIPAIPWKLIVPIAIFGLLLSAGAIVALVMMTGNGDGSSASTWTSTSSGATSKASTTRPSTATQTTGQTTGSSSPREFVAAMDKLVAENARLEQVGSSYATQINNGGAAAITDQILSDIRALQQQFQALDQQAQALSAPPAFTQSKADFLQLVAYNTQRCDSLYSASLAWRNGRSTEALFQEGQTAKTAYQALYPVFEQEYAAAKAGVS